MATARGRMVTHHNVSWLSWLALIFIQSSNCLSGPRYSHAVAFLSSRAAAPTHSDPGDGVLRLPRPERITRELGKMDAQETLTRDARSLLLHFFPGLELDLRRWVVDLCCVLLAIAWLGVYRSFIFRDDHSDKLLYYVPTPRVEGTESANSEKITPDMVLVFPTPTFHKDRHSVMHPFQIQSAFHHKSLHGMENVKSLVEGCKRSNPGGLLHETASRMSLHAGFSSMSLGDQDPSSYTLQKLRSLLLQDLYLSLHKGGFDVSIFKSLDKSHLFLCIRLIDPAAIRFHLRRNRIRLQVADKAVVNLKIQVKQDGDLPSAPFIVYDSKICTNVLGPTATDEEFFRTYAHSHQRPLLVSGPERIRIIWTQLNKHIDLDYAVRMKLISQWFPAHVQARREVLESSWGNWRNLLDGSFYQPISDVRAYFGSQVAFIFAWNGFYAKLLLAYVPVALMFAVLNLVTRVWSINLLGHSSQDVLGPSLCVAIWGRFARNWWKCEENYLIVLWDLKQSRIKESLPNPRFIGTLTESPIDGKHQILQYPIWKTNLRMCISWGVLTICCWFAFLCLVLWLDVFGSKRQIYEASIALSLMSMILTEIFSWLSEILAEFENHKHVMDVTQSYFAKQFIFRFVVLYSPYIHIVVLQPHRGGGCPGGDCVMYLRQMMVCSLPLLAAMRICMTYVTPATVWLWARWNNYLVKEDTEHLQQEREVVELESQLSIFTMRDKVEHMTQLVLTLGYVLIFGGVVPIIVPLCLVVFACQLRAGACELSTTAQRPFPLRSAGIGMYRQITFLLLEAGAVFSGYLLVQYGALFQRAQMITKVSSFLVWLLLIRLIWVLVDAFIPTHSERADLLHKRRDYVKTQVYHESEEASNTHDQKRADGVSGLHGRNKGKSVDSLEVGSTASCRLGENLDDDDDVPPFFDEVARGDWDSIPMTVWPKAIRRPSKEAIASHLSGTEIIESPNK